MNSWYFVLLFGLTGGGLVFYLADDMWGWLGAGLVWGFVTGVFYIRLVVHKYLKPEGYEDKEKSKPGAPEVKE